MGAGEQLISFLYRGERRRKRAAAQGGKEKQWKLIRAKRKEGNSSNSSSRDPLCTHKNKVLERLCSSSLYILRVSSLIQSPRSIKDFNIKEPKNVQEKYVYHGHRRNQDKGASGLKKVAVAAVIEGFLPSSSSSSSSTASSCYDNFSFSFDCCPVTSIRPQRQLDDDERVLCVCSISNIINLDDFIKDECSSNAFSGAVTTKTRTWWIFICCLMLFCVCVHVYKAAFALPLPCLQHCNDTTNASLGSVRPARNYRLADAWGQNARAICIVVVVVDVDVVVVVVSFVCRR